MASLASYICTAVTVLAQDFELQQPAQPTSSPQQTHISPPASYPDYCAKADETLVPLRSVPPLSIESQRQNLQLLQVLTILRHGARTTADKYNCWAGYDPHWDCEVQNTVQTYVTGAGFSPHESSWLSRVFAGGEKESSQFKTDTYWHSKHYDVAPSQNVLGGSCQKGQLLTEGFEQHQIIGTQFAKAYQMIGESERVPRVESPPLLNWDQLENQIYFRSSDMQRTIASGSSFLAAFVNAAMGTSRMLKKEAPIIPLHTMDLSRESLFPNTASCPALVEIREKIFTSRGYLALKAKWRLVEDRFKDATGRPDISDVWPGEIFDCALTTLCSGNVELLPAGLRPSSVFRNYKTGQDESLIDFLVQTVDDYAQFEYRYDEAAFSKAAIVNLVVEFKAEIIRALMAHFNSVDSPLFETLSSLLGSEEQLDEFIQYIKNGPRPDDPKRLVIYAGHDTTVMPFLASLGGAVFNNKWPPYASQVIVEMYVTPEARQPWAGFRLIYNGHVLTSSLPGCALGPSDERRSHDICSILNFFHVTRWATPSNIEKLCQKSTGEGSQSRYVMKFIADDLLRGNRNFDSDTWKRFATRGVFVLIPFGTLCLLLLPRERANPGRIPTTNEHERHVCGTSDLLSPS